MITSETIEQLRRRAADPETRTDVPPPGETSFLGGAFTTVVASLGESEANRLPGPADIARVGQIEERLGIRLPSDLVRLLTEVADGGFGPGSGVASLDQITAKYLEVIGESPDLHGRPWPRALLPICLEPPGLDCVDLTSNQVVFWDEEESAERTDLEAWKGSFRVIAEDLDTWMRTWLASPAPREASKAAMNEMLLDGLRASLDHWRAMTPEQRAEFGLPEDGWEQELFGHLGVDLDEL